jgi:hypothetical protein
MSTTFFLRIEPRTTSSELTEGIAARIYDPLWTLGRQWQTGELLGEDGGSPANATLVAQAALLSAYGHPGSADRTYDPGALPLETLAEASPVLGRDEWTIRLRIDTGRAFLRTLADASMSGYAAGFIAAYSFSQDEIDVATPADMRLLTVARARVPDGKQLYTRIGAAMQAGLTLPAPPNIVTTDIDTMRAAVTAWLAWCADMLFETDGASAWQADTLDYDFHVATSQGGGATVLDATEHRGGSLDWYTFDARPQPRPADFKALQVIEGIPTGVRFRGMPNARWWELEDASVDFGSVTAGASDSARLALVEFALVYANDFFAVPLRLAVGSLCRITSLTVTDTFGMQLNIRAAAYGAGRQGAPRWSMFTLNQRDPADPASIGVADLFFLPPVAPQVIADRSVEDVLLMRDEMGDLAWAIERRYEGGRGVAVERIEEAMGERPVVPPPNVDASLRYVLGTAVPPYWFPLVPEPGIDDVRLQLERMANQPESVEPLGTFLDINGPSLPDAAVPREGRQLLRDYALTRWSNGATYVWSRKRSRIGRGEGSSGLKFDVALVVEQSADVEA